MSARPIPRSSSRLRSVAPISSAVELGDRRRSASARRARRRGTCRSASACCRRRRRGAWRDCRVREPSGVVSCAACTSSTSSTPRIPSEAVKRALALKGIPYKTVELLIPTQRAAAAAALRRAHGAGAEARRRREGQRLARDPAHARRARARPAAAARPTPRARAAVLEAERWGDEVLQPLVRRARVGRAQAPARRDPQLPGGLAAAARCPARSCRLVAPGVIAIERRMQRRRRRRRARRPARAARPPGPRRRRGSPPACSATPTRPTPPTCRSAPRCACCARSATRAPLLAGRPARALGPRLFPDYPGDVPAGRLPRLARRWPAAGLKRARALDERDRRRAARRRPCVSGASNSTRAAADWPAPVQLRSIP